MIEIKKEIGFRFCDNSQVLYASKDKNYMLLHPEIINSELKKLEPYHPITYGKILDLCDTPSYHNDYLHTFISESGTIIGKDMKEYGCCNFFIRYVNAEKQIVLSDIGDYLVINSSTQAVNFYTNAYFAVAETRENNKKIYKIYDRNCKLIGENCYDKLGNLIVTGPNNFKSKMLKEDCFNLYRHRLLEAEKQLLEQKINRVIDLKNKEVVEGTFIDSIRINEGELNLYAENIKELENLTESYKRERIKKEEKKI